MKNYVWVRLNVKLGDQSILYPEIDIDDGDYFFYPFHMKLGENAVLKTAAATPLCTLKSGTESTYVFYSDKEPAYDIEGDLGRTKIITLSRTDAKNAWKIHQNGEHLIISESAVIEDNAETLHIITESTKTVLKVYPAFEKAPDGFVQKENQGDFAVYEKVMILLTGNVTCTLLRESTEKKIFELDLLLPDSVNDWFLTIDYSGDCARAYLDGQLCADDFYSGEPWQIGLKRFDFPRKLVIEIDALQENSQVFLEK